MKTPESDNDIERLWRPEAERHMRAFCAFVARWPNYRLHIAFAMLGHAVATVDSMGGDVEGWLRHLRARTERPSILVPPAGN